MPGDRQTANHEPIVWLDRLAIIFRNFSLKRHTDNGSAHPSKPVIEEVSVGRHVFDLAKCMRGDLFRRRCGRCSPPSFSGSRATTRWWRDGAGAFVSSCAAPRNRSWTRYCRRLSWRWRARTSRRLTAVFCISEACWWVAFGFVPFEFCEFGLAAGDEFVIFSKVARNLNLNRSFLCPNQDQNLCSPVPMWSVEKYFYFSK